MGSKVTLAAWVLAGTLFAASLGTFYWFVESRPQVPDPQMGFTKPINNHGSIHFVTENESTLMNVLDYSAGAVIIVAIVLSWKHKRQPA